MLRAGLAAGIMVSALAACGSTNWGFPYRPNIQQGNWITSEQVDQLQPGMTREQVRYILGTPTLQDVFHANRWDYPYYNNPGYGEDQQRRFTVWFEGDQLVRWEGDQQPDRQPFQKADTGMADEKGKADASQEHPAMISGGSPVAPATETYALPEASEQGVAAPGQGEPSITPDSGTAASIQNQETSAEASSEAAANEERLSGPRRPLLNSESPRSAVPGAPSASRNSGEPLR
jgi:outer membrane protein assembly factor BamE